MGISKVWNHFLHHRWCWCEMSCADGSTCEDFGNGGGVLDCDGGNGIRDSNLGCDCDRVCENIGTLNVGSWEYNSEGYHHHKMNGGLDPATTLLNRTHVIIKYYL